MLTIEPKTKTQQFLEQIVLFKDMIKIRHNMLMRLWEKSDEDVIEILTGLGTNCLAVFTLSYQLQTILKTADPAYEIIYPYHWTIVKTPELNADGTPSLYEDGTPIIKEERTKVLLNVSFKPDGSFESLTEK